MSAMQRQWIRFSLEHMAFLEDAILALDQEIAEHIRASDLPHKHQILPTIPGVKPEAASSLAEFGPNRKVFGSGAKCSAWAGVATKARGGRNALPRCTAIHGSDPPG